MSDLFTDGRWVLGVWDLELVVSMGFPSYTSFVLSSSHLNTVPASVELVPELRVLFDKIPRGSRRPCQLDPDRRFLHTSVCHDA